MLGRTLHKPTPEVQPISMELADHYNRTRTLSDAELVQGGAEYYRDILCPTPEQIEDIENTHESKEKQVGELVLYSVSEALSQETTASFTNRETNLSNLHSAVSRVLEPYNGLFYDELPLTSQNKRNWRGKLKEKERAVAPWSVTRITNGYEVEYAFSLKYLPGESVNSLTSVDLSMFSGEHNSRLILHYNHGQLEKLILLRSSIIDDFGRALVGGAKINEPMNPLGTFLETVNLDAGLSIHLDGMTPSIHLSDWCASGCEYRYDSSANKFLLLGEKSFRKYESDGKARTHMRPESLSVSEFTEIVGATMSILPTLTRKA